MCETRNSTSGDERVICDALRLALVAMDLRTAWHAGVLSAERAMDMLDHAFCEVRPANASIKGTVSGRH
jgi:hypothetical protein